MTFIRAIRQNRLRWIAVAALLAIVAGLLLSRVATANAAATRTAGSATAGAATTQSGSGAKPTIVLVHGA